MTLDQLHSAALAACSAAAQDVKAVQSAKLSKAGSSPGRAMLQAVISAKATAATRKGY